MKSAKIWIIILFSILFAFLPQHVFASFYTITEKDKLNTDPISVGINTTTQLDLHIFPEGQNVVGGEIVVNFDASKIELIDFENKNWFENLHPRGVNSPSHLDLHGYHHIDIGSCAPNCDFQSKNTDGVVVRLTVKGKSAGTTSPTIACSSSPNDSTIEIKNPSYDPTKPWNPTNPNVSTINKIDCTKNKVSTITVTDSSGGTPTPTVTPGGPPVPTATDGPPLPTGEPTCDLCGACKDKNGVLQTPQSWEQCRACLYGTDQQPKTGFSWTSLGCIKTEQGVAGPLVSALLTWITRIAGGIAFLFILYGGYLVLTSQGDVLRLQQGKRTVLGAIGALVIIFFAVFLLQFVGVNILGIPSFK